MTPYLSAYHLTDGPAADAVMCPQRLLGDAATGVACTDLAHDFVRQLRVRMIATSAPPPAPLGDFVPLILKSGAEKQVVRVDTEPYVARMAHLQCGRRHSVAVREHPRDTMRVGSGMLDRGFAVAVIRDGAAPKPARVGFRNSCPKPTSQFSYVQWTWPLEGSPSSPPCVAVDESLPWSRGISTTAGARARSESLGVAMGIVSSGIRKEPTTTGASLTRRINSHRTLQQCGDVPPVVGATRGLSAGYSTRPSTGGA